MNVKEELQYLAGKLGAREAELIAEYTAGCDRLWLYTHAKEEFPHAAAEKAEEILSEREKGRPLQYIFGSADFMGLTLRVNENVLIPRPETEILAELALAFIEDLKQPVNGKIRLEPIRVLDLCTGSGAIICAIGSRNELEQLFASDISEKALELARQNFLETTRTSCNFVQADLFSSIALDGPFDLICSNPPYIRTDEISSLQREVFLCEPHLALDGGKDGLELIRPIIKGSAERLSSGGMLLLEIGDEQGSSVSELVKENGSFWEWGIRKDFSGQDRILWAKKA